MELKLIKTGVIVAAAITLLGVGTRLYGLGAAPLSDFEAEWALQALQVSRSEPVALGPGPVYALLTGVLFYLLDSANFIARLLPALAGAALVVLPLVFVAEIGLTPVVIIALGLALDPGLVAVSRLAGGPMLALALELFAVGFLLRRKLLAAGICAGLALLSGPPAIQGAIILGATYLAGKRLIGEDVWRPARLASNSLPGIGWNQALLTGGVVFLAAGTLFFILPQGLSAAAASLPAYLGGWLQPSGVPVTRLVAALVFYNPLVLIFGTLGAVRGWLGGDPRLKWISLWAFTALLLTLVYPGRQVSDLVWFLVPMWALAGIEIALDLAVDRKDWLPVLGQAILILILLALAWINLAGVSQSAGDIQAVRLRWTVIGGAVFLGSVTTVLVALGWNRRIALSGLAWGLVAGLSLFVIASLWNATQIHANGEQELWYPDPATGQADLFIESLGELSMWRTGRRDSLDIEVLSSQPSVIWALRNFPMVHHSSGVSSNGLPSVIISDEGQPEPSLSAGYRGQDFAWWIYPAWQGGLPPELPRWLVFRESPQQPVHLILWARSDLFPGGVLETAEQAPDEPGEEAPLESPVQ